jgi:CheY-like chemotaxis protein
MGRVNSMKTLPPPIEQQVGFILNELQGAIRVLVIEDDKRFHETIDALLESPLFSLTKVTTCLEALDTIGSKPQQWCCWMVDIELPDGSGINLMRKHGEFPFKVVLSGLRSMETAATAIQEGKALVVLDKTTRHLATIGYRLISGIATIGYLMDGICPDNAGLFAALATKEITSVQQWLNETSIARRRLEQICGQFAHLSPMHVITAFYGLQCVFAASGNCRFNTFFSSPQKADFAAECLDTMVKNWDKVYRIALT